MPVVARRGGKMETVQKTRTRNASAARKEQNASPTRTQTL
jgi:hypothetical protein